MSSTIHTAKKSVAKGAKGRGNVGREKVLEVATQMFLLHGYSGTSMKALAGELGVSAPALYWYFPSKEDLYVEVIETSMRDFASSVQAAVTAADPAGQLQQIVRAHVTWQLDQSDAARTFDLSRAHADDIPIERLDSVRRLQIEYRDQIRKVLHDGCDQNSFTIKDVNVTAFTILTLCEYVYSWFNPQGQRSGSEVAELLSTLVMSMVGYHPSTTHE
ncbi:TetR/AcrR family transcriptional regulator [Leucobacter japonicus]|uniref:TetR/AcrR family transcriptional regulator n=1 Tax=Leucobacter japonicus TaxID=1461259 RepID=UPI0006A78FF2|nr:TetR/AcrR family transcriptional regulator [Leucobacter japonicus]